MNYWLYLLSRTDDLRAADSFNAEDENEAREIAAATYDACSDVFEGYELWQCGKLVAKKKLGRVARRAPSPGPLWLSMGTELIEVKRRRQENALELEERLQETFTCIRESRKLLVATARLRAEFHLVS